MASPAVKGLTNTGSVPKCHMHTGARLETGGKLVNVRLHSTLHLKKGKKRTVGKRMQEVGQEDCGKRDAGGRARRGLWEKG